MPIIRNLDTRIWVFIFFAVTAGFISVQTYIDINKEHRHRLLIKQAYEQGTRIQLEIKDVSIVFGKQMLAMQDFLLRGKDSTLYHNQLSRYYARERETLASLDRVISLLSDKDDTLQSLAREITDNHWELSKRYRKAIKMFNATDESAHIFAEHLLGDSEQTFLSLLTSLAQAQQKYHQEKMERLTLQLEEKHLHFVLLIIFSGMIVLLLLYIFLDVKIKALKNSEIRQHTILETLKDGLIITDEKEMVESLNPAAEKIFGYPAGELVGQKSPLLLSEETQMSDFLTKKSEIAGRRQDGPCF